VQPPGRKLGFAVVGLGKLAIEEVLPAFADSDSCRVVALVTGHPDDKGRALAAKYNVNPRAVYHYNNYDDLRNNPEIDAVYIALPNAMHAEYTIRAARAGKHVLCEKPMATSSADCQRMIDACRRARRALMVAYRIQYEPHNLRVKELIDRGEMGAPKLMVAVNSQNQPGGTWRTIRSLAGGGALPDIGIYCLNTARFLIGQEPTYVQASVYSNPNDPRFREVEESVQFTLWFGNGSILQAAASYSASDNKSYSLMTERGRITMDPGFAYRGLKLRVERGPDGAAGGGGDRGGGRRETEYKLKEANQFALEMDHFAEAIFENAPLRTPGEEGLRDQLLMEAIYQSAQSGQRLEIRPETLPWNRL
jgi:predicted dehydrogenase